MSNLLDEFRTSAPYKGKAIFLFMGFGIIFLIAALDFVTGGKVIGSTTIAILLLPFFPVFLLVKLTSKVRFRNDYVEKISILRRTRIYLKEVKSYGVCIQYGVFVPREVDPGEVDEDSFLADNLIFISTLESNDVNYEDTGETITFQYRKDIYDAIKEVLRKEQVA